MSLRHIGALRKALTIFQNLSNATRKPVQTPRSPLKVRMWTLTFTPSRIQRWSSPRGLPSCTETREDLGQQWLTPAFSGRPAKATGPSWHSQGNLTFTTSSLVNGRIRTANTLQKEARFQQTVEKTHTWLKSKSFTIYKCLLYLMMTVILRCTIIFKNVCRQKKEIKGNVHTSSWGLLSPVFFRTILVNCIPGPMILGTKSQFMHLKQSLNPCYPLKENSLLNITH